MNDDLLPLRIVRIITEIPGPPDVRTLVLEPLDGQPVPYRAGQFLTFVLHLSGHEVRRSYSLSSAPGADATLRVTIKRVENGAVSRYLLDHVRVGDVLTTLRPAGRFILDEPPAAGRNLVLIGAGSGITPLFSLLQQVLYHEPNSHVTLLYANAHEQSVIFAEALNALQTQFTDRFGLIHLLSRPQSDTPQLRGQVRTGRLNNTLLHYLLPQLTGNEPATAQFYLCGPFAFMRLVQITLTFAGIRPAQIRKETFVIPPVTAPPPPTLSTPHRIRLRTRTADYAIDVPAQQTILQAALDHGLSLPYSCRGGRCSTCAARCTAGRVYMTINDVLTERDLADGWILTCTAYPETDGVVIETV